MTTSALLHEKARHTLSIANEIIVGKPEKLKLALCCFLSRGHLLIEDTPGVGKTTLVKLFARLLGLESNRIQFTNDLLPADILGTSIFNKNEGHFIFKKGPIFTAFLIADELNRASPKTQSALLQGMAEGHVSIDGNTYQLPSPFFVVATQNPKDSYGTYPLPESQIDRFLMRIDLGYPDFEAEKRILQSQGETMAVDAIFSEDDLLLLFDILNKIVVDDKVLNYLLSIAKITREQGFDFSTRANIQFLNAAKSMAFIEGRDFVIPEDLKLCAHAVMNHRITSEMPPSSSRSAKIIDDILKQVKIL